MSGIPDLSFGDECGGFLIAGQEGSMRRLEIFGWHGVFQVKSSGLGGAGAGAFHAFHESETGAVHGLGGGFSWVFKVADDVVDVVTGHDGGRSSAATGMGEVLDGEFGDSKHVFHEERGWR